MNTSTVCRVAALVAVALLIPACSTDFLPASTIFRDSRHPGPTSPPPPDPPPPPNPPPTPPSPPDPGDAGQWSWQAGSTGHNQPGIYGTAGVPAASNTPGARMQPAYGSDLSGALWLFGGRAYDPAGNFGGMNDLWKWNGTAWTWVRGSKHVAPFGTYGTKGVADGANTPGGRDTMAFATDCNGRLWIFGGSGYGATTAGELSDLWQFDGTNWVWLSGSDQAGTLPVHGTKGVADPANTPGGREQALAWIDADGTFWLFGGYGYDSTGKADHLNDLWKFDGSSWTWVSGSKIAEQPGVYGTLGIPAPDNLPGARSLSRGFADKSGNLWLFGGYGRDKNGDLLVLNDLWKFDGVAWTWMKGSDLTLQFGVYGTKGVAASDNTPGARFIHASAQDADGNFWVVGGDAGYQGYVNEVWKFDGVNWAWMAGSAAGSQPGVYGTLGVPSDSNHPGSRGHAACWFDTSGRFWLFGGEGFDASGSVLQMLNDMWRYDP